MMQRYILVLFAMMVSSSYAFTASSTSSRVISRPEQYKLQRHMFSTDGNESSTQPSTASTVNTASPLEVVNTNVEEETQPTIRTSTPVERPVMVAKNMNTGEIKEVKWIDPAMQANTNPLQMDWYVS